MIAVNFQKKLEKDDHTTKKILGQYIPFLISYLERPSVGCRVSTALGPLKKGWECKTNGIIIKTKCYWRTISTFLTNLFFYIEIISKIQKWIEKGVHDDHNNTIKYMVVELCH